MSKPTKLEMKILVLCGFDIAKLTWLMIGVWFCFQMVFVAVEKIFFGEIFYHWGDAVLSGVLVGLYYSLSKTLCLFLLNLHLGKYELMPAPPK